MKILESNLIVLDSDELAIAIDAYLVSQRVHVSGPRTISFKTDTGTHQCRYVEAQVYVPSGRLADNRSASEELGSDFEAIMSGIASKDGNTQQEALHALSRIREALGYES